MSDKLFKTGILSDTEIAELFNAKIINASEKLTNDQIQPASLDFVLVEKLGGLGLHFCRVLKIKLRIKFLGFLCIIDLSKGAVLEKGRIYC